ncbi:hypothetical protein DOTSEDRAFT_69410 [Lecanosticta acicola]|uniref:DUF1772 domain-containing protein n=1 Tax=Lecanosticta acicola TaxID=111012 RepID=A0AAI8Z548_9PEZI|nr:hypothetical protein DOTSEDRAFT_69410 [Lecanosticta acicola]
MASTGALWWMTPLQAIAAVSAGVNCGASGLQSVMVFPLLELPEVPAIYSAKQMRWLLHWSDRLFPRVNALSEILNLSTTIIAFLKRHENRAAAEKWPFLAAAFALNVATTAWSLGIQVPMNGGMRECARNLENKNGDDEKSEKEFRRLQARWKPRALVRASMMLASCVVGLYTVYLDGKYI